MALPRGITTIPVFFEEIVPTDRQLACRGWLLAVGAESARSTSSRATDRSARSTLQLTIISELDVDTWERQTDMPRPALAAQRVAQQHARLGHAISLKKLLACPAAQAGVKQLHRPSFQRATSWTILEMLPDRRSQRSWMGCGQADEPLTSRRSLEAASRARACSAAPMPSYVERR